MTEISSTQNPLIKQIIDLKTKASSRKKEGLCIIEGMREIDIAIQSGIEIEKLVYDQNVTSELKDAIYQMDSNKLYACSTAVMEKIAIRDTKQKILAIAKTKLLALKDVKLSETPYILILENIEKPGNIGALLRTSDAANIDLVICTEMQTDLYNHNVIRNSMGCIFSKQVVACSNQEALEFCQKNLLTTFATYLHTDTLYYSCDFKKPSAIVFGSEDIGISSFWQQNADELIKIPMLGKIDSMNVSNSASILLYEVVRQRMN